jgi:hypothetical protein
MKQSKHQRVIKKLLRDGFITRNECLKNYISRLSAIIQVLEEEGWKFDAKDYDKDYIYRVLHCPIKKTEFINPITKETIIQYGKY